jgi:hypothetical protein
MIWGYSDSVLHAQSLIFWSLAMRDLFLRSEARREDLRVVLLGPREHGSRGAWPEAGLYRSQGLS